MSAFNRSARSLGSGLFLLSAILLPLSADAQPVLSVNPTAVAVQANVGVNPPSQTVRVSNAGNRALKWSVVQASPNWVSVSPTNGVNNGTLTLTFTTAVLAAGSHQTSFRVESTSGSPVTVTVNANISGSTPPPLTVTCPANISFASPDGSPVVVTYSASVSGGVEPTWTGSPAPGSSFPVGTTSVQVTATSKDGQTKTCGFSVTVTYSPPPPTGPGVGPQSTITCPSGAVHIFPGRNNIQGIVDLYGPGTTFCLRAGIFSVSNPITPKSGDIFIGEYGAVLDGTGWSSTETTHAAFRAYGQDIDYVTIRNLVIRNMPQCGIHAFYQMSDHWTIEYNEIASNFAGLVFPGDSTIKNNYIHHNYNSAYQADAAHNSTVEGNEIAYNGYEQKVMQSANVTFRNNFIHHNEGPGIWFDANNTGALIEGNRVEDNGIMGIFYEISSNVIIRNNTVRRNRDTGIFISTSKNAQVYGNTLEDNFRGITYLVNCPSVGGGTIFFDLENNTAHHNTIVVGTQSGAFASAVTSVNCTASQLVPYQNGSKNLTFSENSYDVPLPTTSQYWWYWTGLKYWNEWQALGFDAMSTVK